MSKSKISIIIVVLLAAAGAYIYIYGGLKAPGEPQAGENQAAPALGGENAVSKDVLTEEYLNADFGFSFKYPEGFTSSEIEDDTGLTVLVQPSAPSSPSEKSYEVQPRKGFQIYISEFDEEGPITPERVKQDLPDMVINNSQQVLIGEKKDISALIFLSKHESLGDVREVWFSSGGYLYQITAYADMDNFIGPILETLRFE